MENTELDAIRNAVQEILSETGDNKNKPAETPAEALTLNIGGQLYKFDSVEARDKALTETFTKFREELTKVAAPPPSQGSEVTGKESEAFDQNTYIDLMSKNALDAQKYALNHALFDGKAQDAVAELRQNLAEVNNTRQALAAYQFKDLHPEVSFTPENTQVLDGLRKQLGLPFTVQGLESAYGVAQSRGLMPSPQVLAYQKSLIEQGIIPDPAKQPQQTQTRTSAAYPGANPVAHLGFAPPPSPGRSNADFGSDLDSQVESLSLEQITSLLKKAGKL